MSNNFSFSTIPTPSIQHRSLSLHLCVRHEPKWNVLSCSGSGCRWQLLEVHPPRNEGNFRIGFLMHHSRRGWEEVREGTIARSVRSIDEPFRQIYAMALIFHTSLDIHGTWMMPPLRCCLMRMAPELWWIRFGCRLADVAASPQLHKAIYADNAQFVVTNDWGLCGKA